MYRENKYHIHTYTNHLITNDSYHHIATRIPVRFSILEYTALIN